MENFDNPYAPPRATTDVDDAIRAERAARIGADGKLWLDASKGARLANFVIDSVIVNIMQVLLISTDLFALDWLVTLAVMLAYYSLTEGLLGRSPAKFFTKTRVIAIDGGPPSFRAVLVRSLLRLVPFEALSFLGPRGLHDRVSKTRVIRAI